MTPTYTEACPDPESSADESGPVPIPPEVRRARDRARLQARLDRLWEETTPRLLPPEKPDPDFAG